MSSFKLYMFFLDEWVNICQKYLENTSDLHELYGSERLLRVWQGVVCTKYWNESFLRKCVEILPKFSNNCQRKLHINCVSMNPAVTLDMTLKYPEFPWDVNELSRRFNINDILLHSECDWNWKFISRNPTVTMSVILSNVDKPWNWKYLSSHPNITISDIESHLHLPWVWNRHGVSRNPNVTKEMVGRHRDKDWDLNRVCSRMILTIEFLRKVVDASGGPDSFYFISRNPSITLEILSETIDLPWNFDALSWNPCLTVDMLLAFPDKPWNWESVAGNSAITVSDIESHIDLPWGCRKLFLNSNVRIYDLVSHLDTQMPVSFTPHSLYIPDEYVDEWCCKYSVLSMHDEDYGRGKESLDYENALDLVMQDGFCINEVLNYV